MVASGVTKYSMKNLRVEMPQRVDYDERLEGLAHWNKEHKGLLEASHNAGCYYCCTIFSASEIKEWVRSYRKKGEVLDCALCPRCGIDSVLPDIKVILSVELLKEMYMYWFDSDGIAFKMRNGVIIDIVDDDNKYDPQEFAKWKANQLEQMSEKRLEKSSKIIYDFLKKRLDI